MPDAGDVLSEETRLEAALDRLARLRPVATGDVGTEAADTKEVRRALAERLDGLIADLRAVLGRDSAD